jgi:hypothetical protein
VAVAIRRRRRPLPSRDFDFKTWSCPSVEVLKPRSTPGRTDRRTDGHHVVIIYKIPNYRDCEKDIPMRLALPLLGVDNGKAVSESNLDHSSTDLCCGQEEGYLAHRFSWWD